MLKSSSIFCVALCAASLAYGANTIWAAPAVGHHAATSAKGGGGGGGGHGGGGGGGSSVHVSGSGGSGVSVSHGASSFSSAAPHTSFYSGSAVNSRSLSNPSWQGQGNGNWQSSGNLQGANHISGNNNWQGANQVTNNSNNNWQGHSNFDSRVGNFNHNGNNNWNQANGNWNHGNWNHNHEFCPVVVPFAVGWGLGWGFGDYADFGYPYAYPYWQTYYTVDAPGIVDAPVQANFLADVAPQPQLAPDANNPPSQFLTNAKLAFKTGEYKQALRLANHAAVDEPRDARAHEAMSLSLFAINDYRGAAMEAHAAAALGPVGDWAALSAYYSDTAAYTTQLRAMEKFVTENDAAAEGHFLAGYHYLMTGYHDAARQQFEKALELMPKDEVAQQLLKKLGR